MSEDSLHRYGGVLAALARPWWRTVLDVVGVLDVIAAAVLAAVIVTHHGSVHGSVPGCQALTPPAGSLPGGRWRSARAAARWLPATSAVTPTCAP